MALIGFVRPTWVSWNASRKRMSVGCRWRIRYTTASAWLSWVDSASTNLWVRAERSEEIEARPGVSINDSSVNADDGHSTTMLSTRSAGCPWRSTSIAPDWRLNGVTNSWPLVSLRVAR